MFAFVYLSVCVSFWGGNALWFRHDTGNLAPQARKQGSFKVKHRPQKLSKLTSEFFGVEIQAGEHDSAEDARAALLLYYKFQKEWEESLKKKKSKGRRGKKRSKKSMLDYT